MGRRKSGKKKRPERYYADVKRHLFGRSKPDDFGSIRSYDDRSLRSDSTRSMSQQSMYSSVQTYDDESYNSGSGRSSSVSRSSSRLKRESYGRSSRRQSKKDKGLKKGSNQAKTSQKPQGILKKGKRKFSDENSKTSKKTSKAKQSRGSSSKAKKTKQSPSLLRAAQKVEPAPDSDDDSYSSSEYDSSTYYSEDDTYSDDETWSVSQESQKRRKVHKDDVSDDRTPSTQSTPTLMKKKPAIFNREETYLQVPDDPDFVDQRRTHQPVTFTWPEEKDRMSGLGVTIVKVRKHIMGVKPEGEAPIDFHHLSHTETMVKGIIAEPIVVGEDLVKHDGDDLVVADEEQSSMPPLAGAPIDTPFFMDISVYQVTPDDDALNRTIERVPTAEKTEMSEYERLKAVYAGLNKEKIKMLPLEPITVKKKKTPPRVLLPPTEDPVVIEEKESAPLISECGSPRSTIDGDFEIVKQLYSSSRIKDRLIKEKEAPKPPMAKSETNKSIGVAVEVKSSAAGSTSNSQQEPVGKEIEVDFKAVKMLYEAGWTNKPNMMYASTPLNGDARYSKSSDDSNEGVQPLAPTTSITDAKEPESPFISLPAAGRRFAPPTNQDLGQDSFEKVKQLHAASNKMQPIEFVSLRATTFETSSVVSFHDHSVKAKDTESNKVKAKALSSEHITVETAAAISDADFANVKKLYEFGNDYLSTLEVAIEDKPLPDIKNVTPEEVDFESVKRLYALGHGVITDSNTENFDDTVQSTIQESSNAMEADTARAKDKEAIIDDDCYEDGVEMVYDGLDERDDVDLHALETNQIHSHVAATSKKKAISDVDFDAVKKLYGTYVSQSLLPTLETNQAEASPDEEELPVSSGDDIRIAASSVSETPADEDFESIKRSEDETPVLSQPVMETTPSDIPKNTDVPAVDTKEITFVAIDEARDMPNDIDFEAIKRMYDGGLDEERGDSQRKKSRRKRRKKKVRGGFDRKHPDDVELVLSQPVIENTDIPKSIDTSPEETEEITLDAIDEERDIPADIDFDTIKKLYDGGLDEVGDTLNVDSQRKTSRKKKRKKKLYADLSMDWTFDNPEYSKRSRHRHRKSRNKDQSSFPIQEIKTISWKSTDGDDAKLPNPADYSDQESRDPSPLSSRLSNPRDKSSPRASKSRMKVFPEVEPISLKAVSLQEEEESFF